MSPALAELHARGFTVLKRAVFFADESSLLSVRYGLDALLAGFAPVDDQAGALRYHLDTAGAVRFLWPWLGRPALQEVVRGYIGAPELAVRYVRFRQPRPGGGLQRYHVDWHPDHAERRLEIFIAFDDSTRDNGCTEVMDRTDGIPRAVEMQAGSVLVLDAAQPHRGRRNRAGTPRRMIALELAGADPKDDFQVCTYASTPDFDA